MLTNIFFDLKSNLLFLVLIAPLVASMILLLIPKKYDTLIRQLGLFFSWVIFLFSMLLWFFFNDNTSKFQYFKSFTVFSEYNIDFIIGIDGISIFFILLVTFLFPLCLTTSYGKIKTHEKEYFLCFLIMESMLIAVFSLLDIFLFYVFFESVLIPMFLIVVIWGSRERKIRAGYLLFLYTLVGSLIMLYAIIDIQAKYGTTNYLLLLTTTFPEEYQHFVWLAFFISFAIKVPMVPFHLWLPEAHVEAPTTGSVILAGILLKLGTYGILRFLIPLFPLATHYYTPFVYTLASVGVIYASLTAIRQNDMKRIIAYASVAHMNLVIMGLFSLTIQGIEGAIIQSISHGFVSSALFLCVGVLYDRHHTRLLEYIGGVVLIMPIFSIVFLFFTLANIAFPLTSSFVGEFLILVGIFESNTFIAVLGSTGMVLGTIYSLWLYNRICFGQIKEKYIRRFSDLTFEELSVFLPLIAATFVMGIYPRLFLKCLHFTVIAFIDHTMIHMI